MRAAVGGGGATGSGGGGSGGGSTDGRVPNGLYLVSSPPRRRAVTQIAFGKEREIVSRQSEVAPASSADFSSE